MKNKSFLNITVLLHILFLLTITYNGYAQVPRTNQPATIQLKDYSVHLAQADKPYKYRDSSNKVRQAATAYLVFFDLDNMPKAYGPAVNFYIGDYKVPEYGGTKTGIYFRIYDQRLLEKLNKQMIFYKFQHVEKKPFNRNFTVPGFKGLQIENESKLIQEKS